MEWKTKAPDKFTGTSVLCTQVNDMGGRSVVIGWVDKAYDGSLVIMPRCVAWMPIPENIIANPIGWYSEYRGDDLPKTDSWYLVSTEKQGYHRHPVRMAYFDTKKQRFLACDDEPIAWRPLPAPYAN